MRNQSAIKFFTWLFGPLLGIFFLVGPAAGEPSFEGKTLRIIISSRAGGGTDRTARMLGRFMPKYLLGKPKVIYQNMPGGGGIKAANYASSQAKKDGLTLIQSHSTVITPLVLRRKVVKYDPLKFEAIGAINRGGSVVVVRKDALKRLKDPKAKPVIVGALSGTRTWNAMLVWGAEFLGWNLKWVTGYPGTDALTTALLQGEIDMTATQNAFLLRGLQEEGVVELVAQVGVFSDGKYVRRSSFKEVPTMAELLKAKKIKELEWQGYLSWVGASLVDKWMALPPGTPKEYVQAHRQAFDQATKDPKFVSGAKHQLSVDMTPIPGKKLKGLLKRVVSISDEAISYTSKLKKKYGLPDK
jgi:tripartite-type tricarboxylate transporter receptor subunit TctC